MFTIEPIEKAHAKVESGADFPKYIQEIKTMGVLGFETWVTDGHTDYLGTNNFQTSSKPMYGNLSITDTVDKEKFGHYLKEHQQGKTDYFTFCKDCAKTGIEKWIARLDKMTCTYFDKAGNTILVEQIPK